MRVVTQAVRCGPQSSLNSLILAEVAIGQPQRGTYYLEHQADEKLWNFTRKPLAKISGEVYSLTSSHGRFRF